jgi:hypothetical protein
VATITRASPPVALNTISSGETAHVQVAAFCTIVLRRPPITTSHNRADVERFASAVKATSADPCATAGRLSLIQDGGVSMAHAHSRFVWTVNVPDPPAAAMEEGVRLSSTAQRPETGDGARAVVEPELHPDAAPQTSKRSTNARKSERFMSGCARSGRQSTCHFLTRISGGERIF